MSIRLEDTYPPSRITPSDADYPAGSLKNETTPGVSNDGTPLDKLWGNDFEGLKQWLLDQAGIAASGTPDNINDSDLGDALNALFPAIASFGVGGDSVGVADGPALDAIVKSGIYQITGSGSPDGTNTWAVLHMNGTGVNQGVQIASAINAAVDDVQFRHRAGGVWSSWLSLFGGLGQASTTVITVSGTYSPPAGVRSLKFTAIGAGGGGGGADGQGAGQAGCAGGGAAGGSSVKRTNSIESSYSVTVGAGGVGGPAGNNDGSAGGNTTVASVGVNITANGGGGGQGDIATSGVFSVSGGGVGGNASGGDVNSNGNDGFKGIVENGARQNFGDSAGSILGGAVRTDSEDGDGLNGAAFGAGGSGAVVFNVSTNRAGGDGSSGVVIVEELF